MAEEPNWVSKVSALSKRIKKCKKRMELISLFANYWNFGTEMETIKFDFAENQALDILCGIYQLTKKQS